MNVSVLYFAAARERAGTWRETFDLPGESARAQDVLDAVLQAHPELRSLAVHLRVAVNQELVAPESIVPDGAEVALIPPVAGGSGP